MNPLLAVAAAALAAWLYLLLGHARFWRADQYLPAGRSELPQWPQVVAVVPARNEAPFVGRAVTSLLCQDYPGDFRVVLVDDGSTDGTEEVARSAAVDADLAGRLDVIRGSDLPAGWTGKMWAVSRGVAEARRVAPDAPYLLLTDADIEHDRMVLRGLVAHAERKRLDLASLMVKLRCEGPWERLLIPAFVFFFQKLYPFPAVNDPRTRVAGAAGGCMLLRRGALEEAGGITAIHDAVIDDCALARLVKRRGAIWLGLTTRSRSLRPYGGLKGVWEMVARTAFTQLRHSPWLLAGTVAGMALLYIVPPAGTILGAAKGAWTTAFVGFLAWLTSAIAYAPTLRLYGQPRLLALSLPAAALLYTLMTLDSARRHREGRGGTWKGRSYSRP